MEGVASKMKGAKVGSPARGLIFAAVVLLIALIPYVENSNGAFFGESVFGMVSSAVTIVVALGLIFLDNLEHKIAQAVSAVLALLWLATAGILTFRGPFLLTGNGFFASYAGLFMAFQICSQAFLEK